MKAPFSSLPAIHWTRVSFALVATVFLGACSAPSANKSFSTDPGVMKAVMARDNRIVHLSCPPGPARAGGDKPALLLLHGATDDPTEMMDIAREWRDTHEVFLYSFNFHQNVRKVALALVNELRRMKADPCFGANVTIVVYSYSAVVFRAAVVLADEPALFSSMSLVQLVPTAGGSYLARGMANPLWAALVSLASKPSVAQNPYGGLARKLWEGEGNRKFYEAIEPRRMHTLLLEGDSHSVARLRSEAARRRYTNGIGPNVTVIPRSAGVSHEYFPAEPAARDYLRKALEALQENRRVEISTGDLEDPISGDGPSSPRGQSP